MRKAKLAIGMVLTVLIFLSFVGCNSIDKLKKNIGIKNEYFEYLNSEGIEEISIQSVRDPAFKFIVTEDKAISNMYELLSSAKVSETRSELDSDYIFEIDFGDEVKKFNYVVGAYEGNFYDDNNSFTVSKRLDEVLIQNLSFVRKPRDFEYIYYNSILDVMKLKEEEFKNFNYKVGIDIKGDVDCLKYIFSTDLQDFLQKARKITPNVEMVDSNSSEFDVVITVKNRGYDSTTYKTNITVDNKVEKIKDYYYVIGENEFKEWDIKIYEESGLPKEVKNNW